MSAALVAIGGRDAGAQAAAGPQGAGRFALGPILSLGLNRPLVSGDASPTETGSDVLAGAFFGVRESRVTLQIEAGYRSRSLRFADAGDDVEFLTAGVVVRVPVTKMGGAGRTMYALGGASLDHRLGGPYEGDKGRAGEDARAAYRARSAVVVAGAGIEFNRLRLEGRVGWTPWTLSPLTTAVSPFRVFSLGVAMSVDLHRWN